MGWLATGTWVCPGLVAVAVITVGFDVGGIGVVTGWLATGVWVCPGPVAVAVTTVGSDVGGIGVVTVDD